MGGVQWALKYVKAHAVISLSYHNSKIIPFTIVFFGKACYPSFRVGIYSMGNIGNMTGLHKTLVSQSTLIHTVKNSVGYT